MVNTQLIEITHWLPIITFCPVNNLPDFIYVTVQFDKFAELYKVRRRIRTLISGKKLFMENICALVAKEFPDAVSVEVRLMFNKHIVRQVKRNV